MALEIRAFAVVFGAALLICLGAYWPLRSALPGRGADPPERGPLSFGLVVAGLIGGVGGITRASTGSSTPLLLGTPSPRPSVRHRRREASSGRWASAVTTREPDSHHAPPRRSTATENHHVITPAGLRRVTRHDELVRNAETRGLLIAPRQAGLGVKACAGARTRANSARRTLGNWPTMSVVHKLMDAASADTDVLRSLDANGDHFERFRAVEFLIRAPTPDQAETIRGFLLDHAYGDAELIPGDDGVDVRVVIDMPVTQPVILCVSGFMTCVAELFGAELDGWGCIAQKDA